MISKEDVQSANIKICTLLSEEDYKSEPHYKSENIKYVEKIIKSLAEETEEKYFLDIGCGMGFIIDIAKHYFKVINGIDITQAMLEKVDTRSDLCDIHLQVAEVENLPFKESTFNVSTAYAVLHHLHDLKPAFKEIYRVLKPGGVFYSGLDPNYYFWKAFNNLSDSSTYSEIIKKELCAIKHKDDELEEKFNISKETLITAETLKHLEGGFKEEDLKKMLLAIGFSSVKINYDWFLGEAKIIHSAKKDLTDLIRNHLKEMLPLSRHLFKYISIFAKK